jgi:hypothetical protein
MGRVTAAVAALATMVATATAHPVPAAAGAPAPSLTLVPEHSFKGPFTEFDKDGMRMLPNWRFGQSASLNEHFLRLVPETTRSKGFLWNPMRNGRDEWSVTMRFRISGQARKMYGDGLAMWFTQHAGYRDGPIHGFTDTFVGYAPA